MQVQNPSLDGSNYTLKVVSESQRFGELIDVMHSFIFHKTVVFVNSQVCS